MGKYLDLKYIVMKLLKIIFLRLIKYPLASKHSILLFKHLFPKKSLNSHYSCHCLLYSDSGSKLSGCCSSSAAVATVVVAVAVVAVVVVVRVTVDDAWARRWGAGG